MQANFQTRFIKCEGVFLPTDLIISDAFWSLSGTDIRILLRFYQKRSFYQKREVKKHPELRGVVKNSDRLEFRYSEAERIGVARSTFQRSVRKLVEAGFLDVTETKGGLFQAATLYGLSRRWQRYGLSDFESVEVSTGQSRAGFKRGHPKYGPKTEIVTKNGNGLLPKTVTATGEAVTKSGNG